MLFVFKQYHTEVLIKNVALIKEIQYVYISYPRCKDAVLVILCMSLPTTTTVAGEWLNSLIFHDDIKCITCS